MLKQPHPGPPLTQSVRGGNQRFLNVRIESANLRQPFDTLRTSLREFRNYSRALACISRKTTSHPDFKKALGR